MKSGFGKTAVLGALLSAVLLLPALFFTVLSIGVNGQISPSGYANFGPDESVKRELR